MIHDFDIVTPVRIRFGVGSLDRIAEMAAGRRVLLITTKGFAERGTVGRISASLGERLIGSFHDVEPNPTLASIERCYETLAAQAPDAIIALGGGSVIDFAKVLSILFANGEQARLRDHFYGKTPLNVTAGIDLIAIPTTSGTGSEVTPFATVWDSDNRRKLSLAGRGVYPKVALLDPALTLDLPVPISVSTGWDAFSQAFESYWSRSANVITTAWALEAMRCSLRFLPLLKTDADRIDVRVPLMEASLLGGLCISHTRTGIAHSISYPLTAHFGLSHGIACSFSLRALLDFNAAEHKEQAGALARDLGYRDTAALAEAIEVAFKQTDAIAELKASVPSGSDVGAIIDEMITPGRAENNLRPFDRDDVRHLVARSSAMLNLGWQL